jgi:hypothetical protein
MSRQSPRPSKPGADAPNALEGQDPTDRSPGQGGGAMSAAEAARYIESFALELSSLARRSRLDFLAYLLDMVRIEAERCAAQDRRD